MRDERNAEMFDELKEKAKARMDLSQSLTDEEMREWLEALVFEYAQHKFLSVQQKKEAVDKLFYSFRGLDVLQPYLNDETVAEIMVNRHDEIFIEKQGEVFPVPDSFESEQKLEDIIQWIVGKVNRAVNESSPIVDARLQDGSRVHVVLPPVSLKGPTLTIRKFSKKAMDFQELIRRGTLTEEAAGFIHRLVRAKYNIFISGGTGSGKTTFLNVCSRVIPPKERVITIEDSAELQLDALPNAVRLETRNANTEGKGEISMRDLIKASLRMRPDRIIVGEVRGAEALDMLQAMNTGHDGSLSTGHANSAADMFSRLETMVLSGARLPLDVIRKQMASAIDVAIHLSRLRDGTRKVMEISEVRGTGKEGIRLVPLFAFSEQPGDSSVVCGRLTATGNVMQNVWKCELAGIPKEGSGFE